MQHLRTIWHLMSDIPIIKRYAQNASQNVKWLYVITVLSDFQKCNNVQFGNYFVSYIFLRLKWVTSQLESVSELQWRDTR